MSGHRKGSGGVAGRVLDPTVIDGLRDLGEMSSDGPRRIAQLVMTFIDDAGARARRLSQAADAGDADEVRSLAHSLAGSSANLGAVVVADVCRHLESNARAGDLTSAAADVARLDVALAAAATALRAELVGSDSTQQ